jgi:hypothetical protein
MASAKALTSGSVALTQGRPRAVQLPKKISANDSPTMASMPQRCRACGACSREETLSAAYMKYERS